MTIRKLYINYTMPLTLTMQGKSTAVLSAFWAGALRKVVDLDRSLYAESEYIIIIWIHGSSEITVFDTGMVSTIPQ